MTTVSNPYVGPRPFTAAERGRFFGREREARDLLSLVIANRLVLFYAQSGAGKSSLLNTSLIPNLHEAGFATLPVGRVGGDLPDGIEQVDNIFIFNLLLNLDQSQGDVNRLTQLNLSDFLARLTTTDGESFHYDETLPLPPPDAPRPSTEEGQPYVLLIDQFEELITNHLDRWHERAGFFQQVETAMQRDPMLWVVLTLREDFVAALDPYRNYLQDKLRTRFYMQRLGYAEALRAIQKPAALGQRPFAKGVAEKLTNDLRQIKRHGRAERMVGQFIEPVQLQVVCYRLWDNLSQRPLGPITMTDLAELGDVDVALSQFYEQALYNSLSTDPNVTEATLRDWFSHELITEAHTRGTVYYGETHTGNLPNQFVHNLENEYIIRAESRAGALWYELVHDRFIEPILQSNQRWREQRLRMNPLMQPTQIWLEANRSNDKLIQDSLLRQAEEFAQSNPQGITTSEGLFLAESQRREKIIQEEIRQRAIRQRVAVIIATFLAVLFGVLAFWGWQSSIEATNNANQASTAQADAITQADVAGTRQVQAESERNRADQLAATSETQRIQANHQAQISQVQAIAAQAPIAEQNRNRNELQALLAIEAYRRHQAIESPVGWLVDQSLRQILSQPYFNNTLVEHPEGVDSVVFSPDGQTLAYASDQVVYLWNLDNLQTKPVTLSGHTGNVLSIDFSSDGQMLASGSTDKTIRLWNLRQPQVRTITLTGHIESVTSVAFSPDGQALASASRDTTIRLWNISQRQIESSILEDHTSWVNSVAFSPNGEYLASASQDQTIRLWNFNQPQNKPLIFEGHSGSVNSVIFDPNGQTIASASSDNTIRLWNINQLEEEPRILTGHNEPVSSLTFTPNGQMLISAGFDDTIRLWNVSQPQIETIILKGHTGRVTSVIISPDGQNIASTSRDNSVRLWSLKQSKTIPIILEGGSHWISSVAFSPSEQILASAGEDNAIHTWNLNQLQKDENILVDHTDDVSSIDFSSDGRILISGSWDDSVRLWNISQPQIEPIIFLGHADNINSVAFYPRSNLFASASSDRTVRLWDVNQPESPPIILTGHTKAVNSLAFSPDAQTLASGSWDKTILLWDVNQPQVEPILLKGHAEGIRAVAFSPDGQILASGSFQEIFLWNTNHPQEMPFSLQGHTDYVLSVAFSHDGQTLVSSSTDNSIRLWDMNHLQNEPIVLRGHVNGVNAVAFSPDGQMLASGSDDSTVRLWLWRTETLAEVGCQMVWRNLSAEEWQRYIGDEPYRRTCENLPTHPSVGQSGQN